jgi:transketolase
MGDGEQQKGQISEARRLAVKFNLNNLTAIIDYNELQISGSIHKVMPQNIKENWESDGWKVIDINGHNFEQIHNAIIQALESEQPCMILAHTVMGKGVSFMENQYKYHGSTLNETQLAEALIELGCENRLEYYRQMRQAKKTAGMAPFCCLPELKLDYDLGKPIVYEKDTDNRSAWGKAIADLAALNQNNSVPLVVFDCDLQSSVKTADFEKVNPERFIQSGIMEQNTAVASGAMSICNIQTWWADFGMFGIDEVYNAQRLNDINHANLKVVTTHVGMDVGEDGRTHQCIDYIGLARNLYNFRLLCPADPNQTDRIIRFAANSAGNHFITMGRSVLPIITNEAGNIYYDADYVFEYGKADLLRNGNSCAIIVTGTPIGRAMQAVDKLRADGVSLQLWYVATPLELDPMMLQKAAATGCIISIEDHNVNSGLGSIIADRLIANGLSCKLTKLGVTEYPISGTSDDVFKWAGLDRDSLIVTIKKHLS